MKHQGQDMYRALIFLLLLAACNTPSRQFRGIEASTVTIDGSTFDVRVKERRAEALRTNFEYAPRMGPIGGRAVKAIEQVSGCRVHDITGDQAVVQARLDCGNGPPRRNRRGIHFECTTVAGLGPDGKVIPNATIECEPVQRRY